MRNKSLKAFKLQGTVEKKTKQQKTNKPEKLDGIDIVVGWDGMD